MALTHNDQGDAVRITATFLNSSDVATDPTTVTVKYENPAGTETTKVYNTDAEVVRVSQGVYRIDLSPDSAGIWSYRFIGTGAVAQVEEGQFYVAPTDFTGTTVKGGFNEIRERVYGFLRDADREFITESDVDLWITECLDDLSSRLKLGHGTSSSTFSSNTITLPSDFSSIIWARVGSTDYIEPVDETTWNDASLNDVDLSGFYLGRVFNNTIEVYPTPDSGTAYTLRYWTTGSSSLSGIRGNLKLRIVNYCVSRAKQKEGDYRAAEHFIAQYERGLPAPNNNTTNAPWMPSGMGFEFNAFDMDTEARHN